MPAAGNLNTGSTALVLRGLEDFLALSLLCEVRYSTME